MKKRVNKQLKILWKAALIMFFGLLFLKYLPMKIYGENILFDASAHITVSIFALYVIWFFIDQNKKWHLPFFIFSALVLFVVALQRINVNAHNDIGLLLGLLISVGAIIYSQFDYFKGKFKF